MNDMSQTTVNLGYVPKNRGKYSSTASYYKDNIVQYNGSSYICNPPNYDPDTAPTASITGVAPYASDPAVPNTGWAVFCNDSSGVGEGVYNVSVDHTTDNNPKVYVSLSVALQDIPQAKQKGGMEIRFIFNNSNYAVDKEEGITTQPAGTLITSSPTMVDGTYKASQLLTYFSTLPTATGAGNAVVYYKEVDGTYTTWTITLQSSDNKYVQYRLMADSFSTTVTDWQGVDDELIAGNKNIVTSSGVAYAVKEITHITIPITEKSKYINLSGGVGTVAPVNNPTTFDGYNYSIVDVEAGDTVIINGRGGFSPRLYAFVDVNNVILEVYPENSNHAINLKKIAPQGSKKLIINSSLEEPCYLYGKNSIETNRQVLKIDTFDVSNITAVGQVAYASTGSKKIFVCANYPVTDPSDLIEINYAKGAIYSYNNTLYEYTEGVLKEYQGDYIEKIANTVIEPTITYKNYIAFSTKIGIISNGAWTSLGNHAEISVNDGDLIVVKANGVYDTRISFLEDINTYTGKPLWADGWNGTEIINKNEEKKYIVPQNAKYLYVMTNASVDTTPEYVKQFYSTFIKAKEELSSDINHNAVFYNGYIATSGSVVDINNIVVYESYKHAVVPCKQGMRFYVKTRGGAGPRAWAFIDAQYNIISKSDENVRVSELLIAPSDSSMLIINSADGGGICTLYEYKNNSLLKQSNTIRIAAYNSKDEDKKLADFICDGIEDEDEINLAISLLVDGGTIKLLDGEYWIDKFNRYGDSAIYFDQPQRDDQMSPSRTINFEGSTENKAYLSHHGVHIHVRQSVIDSLSMNYTYRVFYGTVNQDPTQPAGFAWMTYLNNVNFKNFYLYLGDASKKLIGIDCSHFGSSYIEQVGVYTETYFVDRFTHVKPPTPVEGCIGVISNSSSNDEMAKIGWNTLNCGGLYIGVYVDGVDHLIMNTCSMCRNVYGYYFNNGTKKTMTLINCCDEGNVHLPYFKGSGHITAIDFNIERFDNSVYPDDPTGDTEFYAQEHTPGSWIGTIEFTMQGLSGAGGGGNHFWKLDNSGKGIRTRNLDHNGYTQPNYPEYLEKYFDVTNNAWKTWNGTQWV